MDRPIEQTMCAILAGLAGLLFVLHTTMTKRDSGRHKKRDDGLVTESTSVRSCWLADPVTNSAKRAWEIFNLCYGVVWIGVFAYIVYFGVYKDLTRVGYMVVCGGLCVPILLSPLVMPSKSDKKLPLLERFGVRANLWMAIYSFIGNYWYTHYFYCVLRASYSMPCWRLNDVPIQLYFATFFYFCFYHSLSNLALRKVVTTYVHNAARSVFLVALVLAMSYFVAFMETLTISAYPDYSFEDREMAYKLGSAFYGIYFIVSFPMFYRFDEWPQQVKNPSLWQTCVDSMGTGMAILTLLDAVRLATGVPLQIPLEGASGHR
eukprot:TRINITY_DN2565_c0_g1_i2.p1 TRINITY_DN2565_c0_g1~~TRINITY_DN2565_c0_g1_i2.p1  ORF type:complete len:319 (-),score=71.65 TRINITY_DN2565_c0_g1_i2:763-1719(-)